MLTIQSVMLIALGFFGAGLLALLLAPAYRKRTMRLTSERLKRSLPVSELEIRADRDRLKADFAMQIFRLEQQLERGRLAAARHLVEVSRREAANGELAGKVRKLETEIAEAQNARNVLEHTVTDRLPQIEQRLSEARNLLGVRNQEIDDLKAIGAQQHHALEAAHDIHSQQLAEIQRLTAQLATAGAANTGSTSDARFDGEVALRSELEALRARAREQSVLIDRLRAGPAAEDDGVSDGDAARAPAAQKVHDAEVEQLRRALDEAQAALVAARTSTIGGAVDITQERELRTARARLDEQEAELVKLRAALATHETSDGDSASGGIKESKLTLRARLAAADALSEQQQKTIAKLNADLNAAAERLARQSEYFAAEMKRLGAGTLPAGFDQPLPKAGGASQHSLAERISRARLEPVERDRKVVELASSAVTASPDQMAAAGSERRETSIGATSKLGAGQDAPKRPKLLERISGLSDS